jgi:hypothetical protein
MSRLTLRLLTLAASACLVGTVAAQTTTPSKPAAPAAKPAAKKAAPAKAVPKPPVDEPLPPASSEQTAAAQMTNFGPYDCEFNQQVEVALNPKYDGYVDVTFGKQKYTMKPVLSSTGALRLEDVKGQTLMLQIAYKSMLMDVKAGRRLVDECVSEKQRLAKQAAAGQPSAGLMSDGAAGATAAPAPR